MEASWYVARAGQQAGPFTLEALRASARHGELAASDLVWGPGLPVWTSAGAVPALTAMPMPAAVAPVAAVPVSAGYAPAAYAAPAVRAPVMGAPMMGVPVAHSLATHPAAAVPAGLSGDGAGYVSVPTAAISPVDEETFASSEAASGARLLRAALGAAGVVLVLFVIVGLHAAWQAAPLYGPRTAWGIAFTSLLTFGLPAWLTLGAAGRMGRFAGHADVDALGRGLKLLGFYFALVAFALVLALFGSARMGGFLGAVTSYFTPRAAVYQSAPAPGGASTAWT